MLVWYDEILDIMWLSDDQYIYTELYNELIHFEVGKEVIFEDMILLGDL